VLAIAERGLIGERGPYNAGTCRPARHVCGMRIPPSVSPRRRVGASAGAVDCSARGAVARPPRFCPESIWSRSSSDVPAASSAPRRNKERPPRVDSRARIQRDRSRQPRSVQALALVAKRSSDAVRAEQSYVANPIVRFGDREMIKAVVRVGRPQAQAPRPSEGHRRIFGGQFVAGQLHRRAYPERGRRWAGAPAGPPRR
jgi:hypothetical protein